MSEIWGMKKYDSLISLYDDSFTSKELEFFFDDIGNFIKKKINLIINKQKKSRKIRFISPLTENEQFELSKYFMKKFGFDFYKFEYEIINPSWGTPGEPSRAGVLQNPDDIQN